MDTQEKQPGGKEAAALEFLRSLDDRALYEQIAQTLVRGSGRVVSLREEGLLVYSKRGDIYMIAARTPETALSLCDPIPAFAKNVQLHGLDRRTAEMLRQRFKRKNTFEFVLYAYYGEQPEAGGADIRVLTDEDVDFLNENYGHADRDYLAQRVREGVMLGVYVEHDLAGFIGEHVEGAMGLLHVMPRYRRMGLGFTLEQVAIRHTMQRGFVPFNQVVPDNAASHRLQKRLGFTGAKGMCYWITDDEF